MRGVVELLRLRPIWLAAVVALSFAVGTPAFGIPPGPVISNFLSGANGLPVSAGVSINFSFSVTDNIDPTGAAVHWDFGDGTTANTTVSASHTGSTSHTFSTKGSYTVTVKVTDDLGAFSTAQITLDVRNSAITLQRTVPAMSSSAVGGQPFTWTATVTSADGTPGTPTGNVTFTNIDGEFSGAGGPFVLGVVPLDGSGVAVLQHSLHVRMGTQRITAAYEGNGTFDAIAIPNATANTVAVGTKGDTTTTVTANSSPSGAGASTSFTVTVAGVAPSTDTPTGTVNVNFGDSSSVSGVALVNGAATVNHTYAVVGTGAYDVNASYNASTDYNGSSATSTSQTVVKGDQTISFDTSAPGSATVGGAIYTPTATASPSGLTVALTVDTASSGVCSVSSGSVSFAGVGTCTINANQVGDANYNAAPQVQQSFGVGKGAQTVNFTSSVPGSATVGGTHYTPTATSTAGLAVTLTVDAASSSVCSMSGGAVSFLAVGSCTINANQAGNANYNAASQVQQSFSVGKGATTLSASATPNPAKAGQAVLLKAAVTVTAPGTGTITGKVIFREGTRKLGEGTIAAGHASFSATGLKIGSHSITANYSGSTAFETSTDATTVTVRAGIGLEAGANSETDGAQQFPAIAKLKNGYAVVWASNGQDGSNYGVYGQRYNANGAKQGGEIHVSSATVGNQTMPKVAGLTGGNFVAVWQSESQDGSGAGIYAQRFSAAGAPSGAEFRVNTTIKGAQTQPAIAALTGGGFVIAWTSNGQDKSGFGVYAQLYDFKAKAVGGEFLVNKTTTGAQSAPSIAALTDGGFMIAWQGPDANGLGIYGQRYDSAGTAVATEFAVNKTIANDQSLPSAAGLEDGGFVVVWQSDQQDGSGLGIYGQRFRASGAKNENEFRANTMTANDQWQPAVSGFSDGGFVVLWTSDLQDGSGKGVYAQAYAAAGAKADAEFLVNTTTQKDQWQPAVAAASAGDFMAAWASRDQDGSLEGVFTQRFMVPLGD